MPREKSDNAFQVSFKIPESWVKRIDRIVESSNKLRVTGLSKVTRTDVLRVALEAGLSETKVVR